MKALITENNRTCKNCGIKFTKTKYPSGRVDCTYSFNDRLFCNFDCYMAYRIGENHPNYKNGTKCRPDGYLRDSKTDRYLHRIIMENHLGRKLTDIEVVHHIDGNKKNNSVDNLDIHTNSSHRKLEVINQKRGIDGRFTT